MEALERARALNALLALPRLERILRVYRTWVNVDGVEGGMALTRRELQCVLEFPELDRHVSFLFDTFRCHPSSRSAASKPRVDLVTLLCTAAVLAQGALADKARFVFALVDLDTEDDIVEAELALVVSTCCDGLFRLRLLQEEEALSEMDALAVAYEAFDFVELEDGDKMTFAQFLKWCVFHPRPRKLLENISCLFAACDAVRKMKEALQERSERLSTETFLHYNDVHFGLLEEQAEKVGVVVGPVVGKVEATRVNVLMEVDARATVKFFAFVLPHKSDAVESDDSVPTQERELGAFKPVLFTISGLSPCTTYVLRFLGIRKNDREKCVAVVTTQYPKSPISSTTGWQVRLLNHRRQCSSDLFVSKSEAQIYEKAALDGSETRTPLLTVHLGAIVLSPQRVSAMIQILEDALKHSVRPHEEVEDRVIDMIRSCYRSNLSEPSMWALLRSHSNWFFEDSEAVLFGGFPGWRSTNRPALTVAEEELARLAFLVWQSYIGCLWGTSLNLLNCIELEPAVIFAPILTQIDLQSEESEMALTTPISAILKAFPSSFAILLATSTPLFPPAITNVSSNSAQLDSSRQWRFIQELVEWNLTDLKRQIFFLSFHDSGSCQARISIKNTTLSLTQLVCGPLIGRPASPDIDGQKGSRPDTSPTDQFIVRFGSQDRRPQYARITLLDDSQKELAVSTSRRRSSGEVDESYVQFQVQVVPLQGLREIRRILGPVVGYVAPRCARVLMECDADGEVTCTTVDRLTLEEHCVAQQVLAYRPSIFTLGGLTPGRVYDLVLRGLVHEASAVLQTPHEQLPAFRLVIVAEDRFLDGTAHDLGGVGASSSPSYIGNVSNHFLPVFGTLRADAVVHLGCVCTLARDLQRRYSMGFRDRPTAVVSQLENSVRECVRQHWNTPTSQQLLSRGAHWLPSIGLLRSLLTEQDVPVSFLKVVQRVLAEYECVGDFSSHSVWPPERYLYRLQNEVAVLMIDTLENILDSAESTPFVQLPETLLSTAQWEALEYWLQSEDTPAGQRTNATSSLSVPNTLVIICDLPLLSQRDERREIAQIWRQNVNCDEPTKTDCNGYLGGVGAMSWNMYPQEQSRLLHLIFGKLQKDPKFHVVFASSGAYASRTTISSKMANNSFQHVVVGPISMSTWPEQGATSSSSPHFGDKTLSTCYSIQNETPTGATKSQQYCSLELVPHPRGASSDVKFYIQHHGEASLILGPILGRITPRTARILIELDQPVPNFICTLTASAGSQSFSAQMKVEAFTPTILKLDGLQPGTRYTIKFEGLIESKDNVWGHILTPPWVPLSSEWLVVNRNSMVDFLTTAKPDSQRTHLQTDSQWQRILAKGMPSFTAQLAGSTSHQNGDSLGDHEDETRENFNPWHIIEDEFLSEPLSSPQLLLHLGGQVNMSRAFTDEELAGVVSRLARQLKSSGHNEESQEFQSLRVELRHRLQEVYRVAWGVPPMKRVLGYSSNLMLLNQESDLYFTRSNLRRVLAVTNGSTVSDPTLSKVVGVLRGVAFELWQLYQNQLWVDLAERELIYGSKSSGNKAAFTTTFGINRVVIANVSHEVYEYCSAVEAEKGTTASSVQEKDEIVSTPTITLFSPASWKVLEEAFESSQTASDAGPSRAAPTRPKNPVQQLVLVISGDIMAWGGSKTFPALRSEIVKLFEKLFAWKFADSVRREISVVCCRSDGSSITFEVTDEKLNEKLTLTCVGSVSEPRELLHRDQKKVKGAVSVAVKTAPIAKGHFSKRFSYRSITSTSSSAATINPPGVSTNKQSARDTGIASRNATRCRTFVSYRFVTDYRRGFLDETLRFFPPRVSMPKAVVGPVIGRMALKESPKEVLEEPLPSGDPGDPVKMHYSVPILLEMNADARVVCVVTDILANEDFRIVQDLKRYQPCVFHVAPLMPERRYVYRFEGIANSESRRGSFHTPPSSSMALNFLALSSNFPEQMEESTDSLWSAIKRRVQVSWCGLDMILHLGGQVPMHEAAVECFEWVRRELTLRGKVSKGEETNALVDLLRRKVRQRLQQRYRLCWNVPNVRETLAHTSNVFLRSQADVAPFFRNHEEPLTEAAQIVLSEAKKIVADYQLSLMQQDTATVEEGALELSPASVADLPEQAQTNPPGKEHVSVIGTKVEESQGEQQRLEANEAAELDLGNQPQSEHESGAGIIGDITDTAQFIQTGEVGIFMCDMRSTPRNDVVTCNNRLMTPLTYQERAIIGEKQWRQLEKALKKKAVMVFVLCMELPPVLTDSKYVDSMREEAKLSGVDADQEETSGRWSLYDRQALSQHWVSCRRQLEQLLNLLFRWKAKHRGRDVIVLSGGMRVGLETLLQDRETKLTVRSLTVGPLTARVEPGFDDMPLSGTACPTFLGNASQRDERFTFAHSVVNSKNYLLTHATIAREQVKQSQERGEAGGETKSASIETEFIADDGTVDTAHPVNQYRRFPSWWTKFVPMGKCVFWDDTVMMRAQSDDDVTALTRYLQDGREFTAALEVLFEKHQFAEAARMEELRSKHRRRQRGPEELRASLRAVFDELWKVLPDAHRQRVAYFRDEFVFDFLLGYLAPTLFETNSAQDAAERPPLEFAAFSTLCRDFIYNACVLHLSLTMQQEEEQRTIALQRAEVIQQAAEHEAQRIQQEQQRAEEEAELARLQQEDPEEYAKRKIAEQESALQDKQAKADAAREQRRAEKMRDVEEELAIAKEQRKLDKLAESRADVIEFNRRRELLAARIRKLDERKRHREADEARRREKKETKRKERAAPQKES